MASARRGRSRAALVEYFKYAPYRFGSYPAKGEARWGAPKYLALVIRRDLGPMPPFDLGDAPKIDEIATGFRRTISDARDFAASPEQTTSLAERDEANKALRRRVFDPLTDALKGVKRLYVAPDSELFLAPFEVLLMDNERYLIDKFAISYLSSGRDVLGSGEAVAQAPSPPVVMAHPNYELSRDGPSGRGSSQSRPSRPGTPSLGPFRPLMQTREEGIKVGGMLGVEPLLDDHAVEGVLKHVHGPCVLHIATHGFFLPSRSASEERAEEPSPDRDAMRRSGLALAGANTAWKGGHLPEDAFDGILYAEDVTALDLIGTELVVLSACDTARGVRSRTRPTPNGWRVPAQRWTMRSVRASNGC
jgi:CHAT domain-containing protein